MQKCCDLHAPNIIYLTYLLITNLLITKVFCGVEYSLKQQTFLYKIARTLTASSSHAPSMRHYGFPSWQYPFSLDQTCGQQTAPSPNSIWFITMSYQQLVRQLWPYNVNELKQRMLRVGRGVS